MDPIPCASLAPPAAPVPKAACSNLSHRLMRLDLTRDFSHFPFKLVELTDSELGSGAVFYLKFQIADDHFAYVHTLLEQYIQPEHIYSKNDSPRMAEARKIFWTVHNNIQKNLLERTHPDEYRELDKLSESLRYREFMDNPLTHLTRAPDLIKQLGKVVAEQQRGFPMLRTKDVVITGIMLSALFFCSGLALLVGKKRQLALITQLFRNFLIGIRPSR